ncbi:MAG: hypothetical protein PUB07_00760 [Clostridia bacterium]|nr:hypothetical protein [Clostridia bacterium]
MKSISMTYTHAAPDTGAKHRKNAVGIQKTGALPCTCERRADFKNYTASYIV